MSVLKNALPMFKHSEMHELQNKPASQSSVQITPVETPERERGQVNGMVESDAIRQANLQHNIRVTVKLGDDRKELIQPIENYEYFVSILVNNNVRKLEELLEDLSETERTFLLDARFEVPETSNKFEDLPNIDNYPLFGICRKKEDKNVFPTKISRPLILAIFARAVDVVTKLLDYGADPCVIDDGENNVVHVCILSSGVWPDYEEIYRHMYRVICANGHCSRSQDNTCPLKHLLLQENAMGYRPLELASKAGAFGMFMDIFNTEGVYRHTQSRLGLQREVWYDVTEYSGIGKGKRNDKSPLEMLQRLTYDDLENPSTAMALSKVPLRKWLNIQSVQMRGVLVLWMFARFVYLMSFIVVTWDYFSRIIYTNRVAVANTTSGNSLGCQLPGLSLITVDASYYMLVVTLSLRFFSFTFAIIDFVQQHRRRIFAPVVSTHRPGTRVTDNSFYEICDLMHILSAVMSTILIKFYPNYKLGVYICLSLATILNVWSFLYFIRFFPLIGHFVIIFQEMFRSMLNFLVVYGVIYVSFALAFYVILGSQCASEDFETLGDAFYSTFIITLNMINVLGTTEIESDEGTILWMLHISYVLIVAILLINFLIAVMSNTVSQIGQHRKLVLLLNRVEVILSLQRAGFANMWFRMCKKLAYAGLIVHNDRIYMPCLLLREELQD